MQLQYIILIYYFHKKIFHKMTSYGNMIVYLFIIILRLYYWINNMIFAAEGLIGHYVFFIFKKMSAEYVNSIY